jgi:hypothetical protein
MFAKNLCFISTFIIFLATIPASYANSETSEQQFDELFGAIGFSDVRLHGCVLHGTVIDAKSGSMVYEQRVDLRTLDFSTFKLIHSSDGWVVGSVRFNEIYEGQKATIDRLSFRFGFINGKSWLEWTSAWPEKRRREIEKELLDSNIYFWNFQRFYKSNFSFTEPYIQEYYLIGDEKHKIIEVFHLLELTRDLPICDIVSR